MLGEEARQRVSGDGGKRYVREALLAAGARLALAARHALQHGALQRSSSSISSSSSPPLLPSRTILRNLLNLINALGLPRVKEVEEEIVGVLLPGTKPASMRAAQTPVCSISAEKMGSTIGAEIVRHSKEQ